MAVDLPTSLTSEIGSSVGYDPMGGTATAYEDNPELRFPLSTSVYDRMRKTDGQVSSTMRAIRLPIQATEWHAAGSDCDPRVISFVESNLGLQEDEKGRRRKSTQGISWDNFLRQALIHLPVGFMPFEKTYEIVTEKDLDTGLPISAHLGRLSPRMPRTIAEFVLEQNGDLKAIKQWVQRKSGSGFASSFLQDTVTIPIESLVLFTNEQEGSDFAGNSILRSAWIDWTIKSKMIRLNAIGIERESVGMPKITVPEGGSMEMGHRIGREYRATERSHIVVPEGYLVENMGTTGQTRDPLPSIKYHDEMIGRSALAMFLNLGHDRGSQSLGETFRDLFSASLNAVLHYIEEVITEQVVRELVRINFGEDEPYPTIEADEITPETALTPEGLKALADAGMVTPDGELEDDIRRRHGLPKANPARRPKPKPLAVVDPAGTGTNPQPGAQAGNGDAPSSTGQPTKLAAARSVDQLEMMRIRAADLRASIEARQEALAMADA